MIDNNETEEVLAFLTEMEDTNEPESNEAKEARLIQKADLTDEEFEFLSQAQEEVRREVPEDVEEIEVRDDFKQKPYKDLFSSLVADLGPVSVSNLEKDLFIKSLLNDTPFITTSNILGGKVNIKVRSRSMFTDNLIFKSLSKDDAEKRIVGMETLVQQLQAYVAAIQILEINGRDYTLELDNNNNFETNYEILGEHLKKYDVMQTHMWAAIVMAVRIHEYKTKICMDNLNNENFWVFAGIN